MTQLKSDFREAHAIPSDTLLVGMADELSDAGGVRDVVVAGLEVLRSAPKTRFLIVGIDRSPGRSFRRELRRLTRTFEVEENFIWLDAADQAEFYAAIDIFLSVPHLESSGLSVLEAMSHSKAVVASATEGMMELLGDERLLATPGDPSDLARRLIELAQDDQLRMQVAGELRRRAVENYSLDRMIEATEQMYRSVL